MRVRGAPLAFLLLAEAPGAGWSAQDPSLTPSPSAADARGAAPEDDDEQARPAPSLKLDIERHVDALMERERREGPLRFEEKIEVRDRYQESLEEILRGVDLVCGASESGPPTVLEMRRYGGASIPVHADFLGVGKVLYDGLKRLVASRKPRYFLYGVRLAAATPGRASQVGGTYAYVLREGPLPEATRWAAAGTSWELIASFSERDPAAAALRRRERGFARAQREHEDARLPPWVSTTCRPPRLR